MIRSTYWAKHLDREIARARHMAFALGEHDCGRFPARCVQAMTGIDLFIPFAGRYSTPEAASALIPDMGAYIDALARQWGWDAVSPALARRGDLAVVTIGVTRMCAVVYDGLLIPEAPRGLRTFTVRLADHAWRIG